jgi:hypothetical protein
MADVDDFECFGEAACLCTAYLEGDHVDAARMCAVTRRHANVFRG